MVRLSTGTFRCILLTPSGRLLDCRAGSVILPGHDGQLGILRNHTPMLCSLGMGIMEVKFIPDRDDAFYLLDGGFARISENNVTVLAHDVTTFEDMARGQAEQVAARAREIVTAGAYIKAQLGTVDIQRSRQIVKLAKLAKIIDE